MKTIIIKKMLSTLLMASCLTTTPSFVSAANDGLGDSKPAAWAKNSQNELENDIKELDEVIADLKEKIEDYESDRDTKIKEIDGKIKLYSKKLKKLEKKLNPTGPRKKFKSLETKNLLKIIDRKLKRITKKLNSSCQCDDRLKKQFEFLKRKIERLLKEKESVESKFQENAQLEREQLKLCAANKSEKIKRLSEERDSVESKFQKNTQLEREQLKLCAANKKVLKEKASDLYEKSGNLRAKFISFSEQDKNKLSTDDRCELLFLPDKFKQMCEKGEINQQNIDEFTSLESTFKYLQTNIDAINSVEDSQSESLKPDQAQEKLNLWKKINSGSQSYQPNHVADNLCWLHSATNVLNYYDNMKNKGIVKGQRKMVEQYRKIMGDQTHAKNINGSMQEFPQIAEYLEKCGLGSLQITISSSSTNAQQKIQNTAKELLKSHFNKTQNTSPVIGHTGGRYGHFITIADYDQNQDQFLIVDSLNYRSIEASVKWINSKELLQTLTTQGFCGEYTLELGFTSNVPEFLSCGLTINENNSIVQRDLAAENAEAIQTSIDALKSMIEYY